MKLLRWTMAGASIYVMYKYSIGKKAKGEDVFVSPERALEDLEQGEEAQPRSTPEPAKRTRSRAKRPSK